MRVRLIDQRVGETWRWRRLRPHHALALPEAEVAGAAPGSASWSRTRDYALDFLIADAALARGTRPMSG